MTVEKRYPLIKRGSHYPPPTNTAMSNGPPDGFGTLVGSSASPTISTHPVLSVEKHFSGSGANYEGGAGWFSTYHESGTQPSVGLTGYIQGNAGAAPLVGIHGYGVIASGVSGASVWAGWFTAHDNNNTAVSQCMGIEIDLVLFASRSHVTATIGPNPGVGLWINNQSDEVGNFNGTAAIGITGESNSGGLGFTSQWYTGIFVQQDSIVPGQTNEGIQINGGSIAANSCTGIRLRGNFNVGLDLSTGTYNGTAAAILLPGGGLPILVTNTTVTSGAGSSAGTLTNAPAAGNPTKWIPFNDAGTLRYIPAW